MATASHSPNPRPAPGGGVTLPPSQEKINQRFDLAIALALSTWSALTLSVQNSWGGPQSAEKRDWFAGAISDLFQTTGAPDAVDVEYLEEFLLQVMNDEFEVNVEDGSAAEVAAKIVGLRKLTLQGEFGMVDEMYRRWVERQGKGVESVKFQQMGEDEEDDDDEESDSEEVEDEDGDVNMDDAPQLVKPSKQKIIPKVDDDGFTEVVARKRK
ncbi:MAG: hypothetical protein Q9220_000441 [cf. Caloplaca sp. 1 TL-2023]